MTDHVSNTASPNVDLGDYDKAKYCGHEADSNLQSTVTTGGEDNFSRYSGGGDDVSLHDSNLGAGGKSLG